MDATFEGNDAQARMADRLAELLARIEMLRGGSDRQSLVAWMMDVLGGPNEYGSRNLDLARFCLEQPYRLTALMRVVGELEPDTPALTELLALRDELTAAARVPDLGHVLALLQRVKLADTEVEEQRALRGLFREATSNRVDELPPRCRSARTTFLYLTDFNAPAGGPPPAMVFVAQIADFLANREIAAELTGWNQRWAERTGTAEALRQASAQLRPPDADRPTTVRLVFEFDPDPFDDSRVMLSHWRHWGDRSGYSQRRGGTPVLMADLESEVDDAIGALETTLAVGETDAEDSSIVLEFILPWEMLNTPVESWRRDSTAVPLGIDYPVVLRSLDRMRAAPRYHDAWRRRWQALVNRNAPVRPYWSHAVADGYETERLAFELLHSDTVSLVLSEPPGARGGTAWREAAAAFRAGLPVIIWDREDCAAPGFRDAVSYLVEGEPTELPDRVARLKRDALIAADRQPYAGRTLAILWDDPNRMPEFLYAPRHLEGA
ncbi:effector-associated domain 2-containing protein [Amycolatopsis sp. lyj-23]|uniref:VMAP-C domain-containing protein n=1 Tax=Amycolatopsis sp. lyj-23 TaxID=2789283 RepID=UPI00397C0F2A